jgi:Domain of unknown function (DUF5666)
MKKYKTHVIWGIVAVIALIGGFFWGKSMAAASSSSGRSGRFAFGSSTSAFAGRTGASGGFEAGTVAAIGNESITLQLPNGNSQVVFYSSSTQVVVPQTTSISSIQPGAMVMVGGTQNSDGSMTATTIQVRNGAGSGSGAGTGGQ